MAAAAYPGGETGTGMGEACGENGCSASKRYREAGQVNGRPWGGEWQRAAEHGEVLSGSGGSRAERGLSVSTLHP